MKKNTIIYLTFFCFILVLPITQASIWDYLTIGRGDVRYCKQNGFCILDNLTVNNYVNFTVTNYNVTGGMTVDNLTAEYITSNYYCDSTGCYSIFSDLLNNASFNSSYIAELYVPYTGASSNVDLGGNNLTANQVNTPIIYNPDTNTLTLGVDRTGTYEDLKITHSDGWVIISSTTGQNLVEWQTSFKLLDNRYIGFGSHNDVSLAFRTGQTNDTLILGLPDGVGSRSPARAFIIGDQGDVTYNFDHPEQDHPTLFLHSANQSTTEWVGLTHNSLDGVISTGVGDLVLSPDSGNVGIGTTTPSAPLSVIGGVTISDYLHTKGGAVFNDDGLTPDFRVESNDETNMFIVDGGNNAVGIRTHTPASTLDVDGNLTVSERIGVGTTSPAGILDVQDGTGTQTVGDLSVNGSSHIVYVGQLDSVTGNTKFIFRDRLGNEKIRWEAANYANLLFPRFGPNYGVGIGYGITNAQTTASLNVRGFDSTSSYNALNVIDSGGDSLFLVRNDGKVGIGTSIPTYALDVVGDIGLDDRIYHNGDVDTYTYMLPDRILSYAGAEALLDLYEGTQDYVKLGDGGDVDINFNNDVYINGATSMMGVGTSNPTSYLHTRRSFATGVTFTDSNLVLTSNHGVVLVDATEGAITITLPKVSECSGRWYMIKKIDASVNVVTIEGDGGETIDGVATYPLSRQWSAKTIVAYFSIGASGWFINDR